MTVIFIGAIIAVVGGLISAIGTLKHNKNSSEKSTRIEKGVNLGLDLGQTTNSEVLQIKEQNNNLAQEAILLKDKIEKQENKIDELRKENTDLYSKLADASKEIHNNLTGGDSYCRMDIGSINPAGNEGYLVFFVEGKYPLSSIQARIVDLNSFDATSLTMEDLSKNVMNIGTLEPDKAFVTNKKFLLDKNAGVNLNVFFVANNGFVNQLIRMRFINNVWVTATRISTMEGKILFEDINPNYPEKDTNIIFK